MLVLCVLVERNQKYMFINSLILRISELIRWVTDFLKHFLGKLFKNGRRLKSTSFNLKKSLLFKVENGIIDKTFVRVK